MVDTTEIPPVPDDPVLRIVMAVASCFVPGQALTLSAIADEVRPHLRDFVRAEIAATGGRDGWSPTMKLRWRDLPEHGICLEQKWVAGDGSVEWRRVVKDPS